MKFDTNGYSPKEIKRWMPDPESKEFDRIKQGIVHAALGGWEWTWVISIYPNVIEIFRKLGYNIKVYGPIAIISWKDVDT